MLCGARAIIPAKAQDKVMKLLYQTHSGMSGMKGQTRSCVAARDGSRCGIGGTYL